MKDLFSEVSELYSKSRPGYPELIIDHILSFVPQRNTAWDVATGNGQVAGLLSPHFKEVIATDISEQQLSKAPSKSNIIYKKERAENSSIASQSVNLVTIGQAIHWFDFTDFYSEVNRVIAPDGVIAAIGYALIEVDKQVDEAVQELFAGILNNYWDPERKYTDDYYKEIPFPFEELPFPEMNSTYNWTLSQLLNNFRTWSAVNHYKKKNNVDPVKLIEPIITKAWGNDETKQVRFPIFGRMGRVNYEL